MSRPTIHYTFSFISLWTYLGSTRLLTLSHTHNARIIYHPVDLLHIFSLTGGLPVAQRSPQRQAYRLLEMQRWRRIRNLPINPHPKFYPADPSLAHRVLLAAISEDGHDSRAVSEFARKGCEAVWAREMDIADSSTVAAVANECGLDGERLLGRAEEAVFVEEEKRLTDEAVGKGLFGGPTYTYRGEMFWGQDKLEMLDEVVGSGREVIEVE